MIIPFIFSLAPFNNEYRIMPYFNMALSFCKEYGWPIIAQEVFFTDINLLKPHCEYAYSEWAGDFWNYDIPENSDLDKIIKVPIPKYLEDEYIKRYPSKTDAFLSNFTEEWKDLEDFLEVQISRLEEIKGEKIEAFITIPNMYPLQKVASKMGIPVISHDGGPFRPPYYNRLTSYFDFGGVLGWSYLERRYKTFIEQGFDKEVPMFTNSEILALFLSDEYLSYALRKDTEPEYEIGILGDSGLPHYQTSKTHVSTLEMIIGCKKFFSEEQIIIRPNPFDLYKTTYSFPNIDNGNLLDFIIKCRRVVASSSNVSFEAMLFAKPSYILGWNQYRFAANQSLDKLDDDLADERFLNFNTFANLVPFEFLNNIEYIRFRLANPSEKDIYEYNLNYYLNSLEISKSILDLPSSERLLAILKARGFDIGDEVKDYSDKNIWISADSLSRKDIIIYRYKKKIIELEGRVKELNNQIADRDNKLEVINDHMKILSLQYAELENTFNMQVASNSELRTKHGELTNKYNEQINASSIISEKYNQLEQVNDGLIAKHNELNNIYKELNIKHNELKNSYNEVYVSLNTINSAYNEILNSTTYKLTKPIRSILDLIKRI